MDATPPVSKLEELLNVFGNTCYQLGLAKDWLLPASESRQAVLAHVAELVAAGNTTPAAIQRVPVKSSNINSIGYRESDSTLEIEFKTLKVYQYLDVPYEVWESLMMAESKGTFFGTEIKKVYTTICLNPRLKES